MAMSGLPAYDDLPAVVDGIDVDAARAHYKMAHDKFRKCEDVLEKAYEAHHKKRREQSYSEIYSMVSKIMGPVGEASGREIANQLKGEDKIVLPLYRSAVVITVDDGYLRFDTYNDPAYMGQERTKENIVSRNCNTFFLNGQRNGVEIIADHMTVHTELSIFNISKTFGMQYPNFRNINDEDHVFSHLNTSVTLIDDLHKVFNKRKIRIDQIAVKKQARRYIIDVTNPEDKKDGN